MEKGTFCNLCKTWRLKASRRKPINYSKILVISQEPNANSTTFLERFKEAIIKYTNLDLDSLEGKNILKDRFLTQSTPDIRRKLQNLMQETNVNLDELLAIATTTFYIQDQEEEVKAWEKEKSNENRQVQLLTALQGQFPSRETLTHPNGSQNRHQVCRKPGHWVRECPQKDKPPKTPCPKCQKSGLDGPGLTGPSTPAGSPL